MSSFRKLPVANRLLKKVEMKSLQQPEKPQIGYSIVEKSLDKNIHITKIQEDFIMKYTHNADGSTTIHYTKAEAQKHQHYRGRCEEMLKRFSHPDDMERVYNVLVALAEIGSEECEVVMEDKDA